MFFNKKITNKLIHEGADFVHFVDISHLSEKQNKGYPNAILFGMVLSPDFVKKVTITPDYVKNMVQNNQINEDEFHLKEQETDRLADDLAIYITSQGYKAYSQSENNIYQTGFYDEENKYTPLPHKTIALMAGIGWIGKHNLLITPEFGCAVSMCTVLTDVPLKTVLKTPMSSRCGNCSICLNICTPKALNGSSWGIKISRDKMLDITKCDTCLKCLAFCTWTQAYMRKNFQI